MNEILKGKYFIFSVLFLISVVNIVQRYLSLEFPIIDAFHYGEFFAAGMGIIESAPFQGGPFTIHGAVDYIPLLLVYSQASEYDTVIASTIIFYPFLNILTIVASFALSLRVAKIFGANLNSLIPVFALLPFCVSWRDLFFVLSLLIFTIVVAERNGKLWPVILQVLFGLTVALGVYWSFNRGAVILASMGPLCIWMMRDDRKFLISISVAILSFFLLGTLSPLFSVQTYFENFVVLLQSADQWSYPPSLTRKAWTVCTVFCFFAAVVSFFRRHKRKNMSKEQIVTAVSLLIASALYTKIGLGRIDHGHIVMALWLPLLFLSVVSWGCQIRIFLDSKTALYKILVIGLVSYCLALFLRTAYIPHSIILIIALLFSMQFFKGSWRAGGYTLILALALIQLAPSPYLLIKKIKTDQFNWMLALPSLPVDALAVPTEVRWASERLLEANVHCVFDLGNTGLINALTRLPSCSQFSYPVYASSEFEEQLVSDLKNANPPAIVYSTNFWSYRIDGLDMPTRFPELDAFIQRAFPVVECEYGVCVRLQ